MELKADIAILGCGFAGSLAGTIARRLGRRVVIVDRDAHPRFAIGESSTPAADMILRRLCDRYDVPRLRPLATWGTWQRSCPHVRGGIKRGFSYFMHEPGVAFAPNVRHSNELLAAASPDDEHSDTQWYRADVDAFFAEEAARAGTVILENTVIDHVERAGGWQLQGVRDGEEGVSIRADFVIDATGAAAVLSRHLNLPTRDMRTRSRAVFGHFTGVPRWTDHVAARGACTSDYPFDPDFSALHHVLDGSWMWMLRFKDETLSAGFAIDEARYPVDPSVSPYAEFFGRVEAYPSLQDVFSGADVADPPGKIIRTGRLQRWTVQAAGPDWALLPHAAGFVDPLHSTGIAHALCGIERLMDVLSRHWTRPELTPALESYSRCLERELAFIDLLVSCCYRSMGDFRLWAASTMLYFAAAASYERLQTAGGDAVSDRLFLLADEPGLFDAAVEASRYLDGCSDIYADGYEHLVDEAVRPYNHVGLFHPEVPNMYARTAAQKEAVIR
jgi:FADH2 O2-dependent halogenase